MYSSVFHCWWVRALDAVQKGLGGSWPNKCGYRRRPDHYCFVATGWLKTRDRDDSGFIHRSSGTGFGEISRRFTLATG